MLIDGQSEEVGGVVALDKGITCKTYPKVYDRPVGNILVLSSSVRL